MKIVTPVEIHIPERQIDLSSKILCIGSCFADLIGERLKMYGFDCLVNPFGPLYNVASIEDALLRMACVYNPALSPMPPDFAESEVFQRNDGKYVTWNHHSRCGLRESDGYTISDFLDKANQELQQAADFLNKADTVIITLGTSYVYKLKRTGFVVANCHKENPNMFKRMFYPVEKTARIINRMIDILPGKRFIFTVSPIRHLADGAHGNNLSKSTMLLAIDKVSKNKAIDSAYWNSFQSQDRQFSPIEYFPSYEIMMDELRDYRWYAEDMVHPSEAAVKYIFERFSDTFIAKSCKEEMQRNLKAFKASNHQIR